METMYFIKIEIAIEEILLRFFYYCSMIKESLERGCEYELNDNMADCVNCISGN